MEQSYSTLSNLKWYNRKDKNRAVLHPLCDVTCVTRSFPFTQLAPSHPPLLSLTSSCFLHYDEKTFSRNMCSVYPLPFFSLFGKIFFFLLHKHTVILTKYCHATCFLSGPMLLMHECMNACMCMYIFVCMHVCKNRSIFFPINLWINNIICSQRLK